MLYEHTDQTFLHTCAKTQLTAIHISHVTGKYILEINMSINVDIYAKYEMVLYGRYINMVVPYMKFLKSTMQQRALYIYHWPNMAATLYIYIPLYCYCSVHTDPTLVHI